MGSGIASVSQPSLIILSAPKQESKLTSNFSPFSFFLFIWNPIKISYNEFFLITIASILINIALFLATFAFKKAQRHYSAIFCLVYLQIVWSSFIGFYFFNEYLNTYALIGASLIALSGIISVPGQIKQADGK